MQTWEPGKEADGECPAKEAIDTQHAEAEEGQGLRGTYRPKGREHLWLFKRNECDADSEPEEGDHVPGPEPRRAKRAVEQPGQSHPVNELKRSV